MNPFKKILSDISKVQKSDVNESKFHARPVGEHSRHYFGRDLSGFPCLLIQSPDKSLNPSIRLALLDVNYSIPCKVEIHGGLESAETLTVIVCKSLDSGIESYFAYIAEVLIKILGPNPSTAQVAEVVRRIIGLFESLSLPSRRSVAGLFGELFLVHVSQNPKKAVEAWHRVPGDIYDFSFEDWRLEVKASTDRVRAHHFSLEQCSPPQGVLVVLASMFLEHSGSGLSLRELIDRIEIQLADNSGLVLKIHEIINMALGKTLPQSMDIKFNESLARSSLLMFRIEDVPSISGIVPEEVSQVHFRSDLSNISPVNIDELARHDPEIVKMLPSA